jgi:hypothetical protein
MCLDNVANIFTILSFIVAVFAVIAAFFIPRKIMVNQIYADLLKEYRSTEMGEAIMGLIDFYIIDCHRNVSLIEQEYKKIFNEEIDIGEDRRKKKVNLKETLHFKRRLLWQYYWQLSTLRSYCLFVRLSKKRLKNDFTESESQVIAILCHTATAVKDIFDKTGDIQEPDEQEGKTEKLVYRLYEESKEW